MLIILCICETVILSGCSNEGKIVNNNSEIQTERKSEDVKHIVDDTEADTEEVSESENINIYYSLGDEVELKNESSDFIIKFLEWNYQRKEYVTLIIKLKIIVLKELL